MLIFLFHSEVSHSSSGSIEEKKDSSKNFEIDSKSEYPIRVSLNAVKSKKQSSENFPHIHRTVIHTEAYKSRTKSGPHVNFKITPPEKRGRRGRVLVEVYNYSNVNFSVINFWMILSNSWGDRVEVEISCEEILRGWSALKWVKIPGDEKIPEITTVQIQNFKAFNDKGQEVKIKYTTDLIKK